MYDTRQMDNHADIREWAARRGGRPAVDMGPEQDKDASNLAFAFGDLGERVREISWDEWFERFDAERLSVWAQERGTDGGVSRYYKIVQRDGYTADGGGTANTQAA